MRIEPEQVQALVEKLREWGVQVSAEMHQDLRDEFDVRSNIDENKIGKYTRKSLTSRQMALVATPKTGTQRRRVYDFIYYGGRTTREEIAQTLRMPENSVRPRIAELMEGGWVKVVGYRKNSGNQTVEILAANGEKT